MFVSRHSNYIVVAAFSVGIVAATVIFNRRRLGAAFRNVNDIHVSLHLLIFFLYLAVAAKGTEGGKCAVSTIS